MFSLGLLYDFVNAAISTADLITVCSVTMQSFSAKQLTKQDKHMNGQSSYIFSEQYQITKLPILGCCCHIQILSRE